MSQQLVVCFLLATATSVGFASRLVMPETRRVAVMNRPADQRVDISIDGQAFTNYPTYWHARGYGLFAANPIGRHAYDSKQPARV